MNPTLSNPSNNLKLNKSSTSKLWFRLSFITAVIVLLSIAAYFLYQKYNPLDQSPTDGTNRETVNNEKIIPPTSEEDKPMKLAINEVKVENGKLHAAITVENRGHLGFEKLLYSASLVGQAENLKDPDGNEINIEPTPITQIMSAPFSLKSGMVEKFTFDLDYPKGAPIGEYNFIVEVRPPERINYAQETQKITLNGTGPFLKFPTIKGCKIIANDITYDVSSPNIKPNEPISAQCDVENTSNQTTTAKPIIKYAETSVFRNNQSETKTIDTLSSITLKPNEKKTVQFTLPAQSKPQSYDAQIHMVGEDNLPLSNFGFVRYSIIGSSATIQTTELSTSTISKGDSISLDINAAPSADLFHNGTTIEGTYLKQPKLTAQITSASTPCAQKTIDLPANQLSWKEVTMNFRADVACPDPLLTIKITEAGQELASFQKQYISSSDQSNLNQTSTTNTRSIIWIIMTVIFLLIIIVILITVLKNKKSPNSPIVKLLIFFAGTALFFGAQPINEIVNADIVIPAGGSQVTVVRGVGPYWVSYNTSSAITYNGSNNVHVYFGAVVGAVDRNWYMSDRVRIWVDGGSPVRDYVTVRSAQQAPCACQGVDHHDDISVSAGQHNVEARIYAVQWSNSQFGFQADSGIATSGDQENNNCGSSQACYGRLGFSNRGNLTANLQCSGSNPQILVSYDLDGYQYESLYRNGSQYYISGFDNSHTVATGYDNNVTRGQSYQYRVNYCQYTGDNNGIGCQYYDSNTVTIPSSACIPIPTLTLTTNPTSAWAPGGTTISWSGANHPAGTTCTNTWNSLNINPNTAGSDYRVLGPGNYTFTINCSNGISRSATFTVNQLPPPTIQLLGTGCNYSQPYAVLRLIAPNGYPGAMTINLYTYGSMSYLAYQANLGPGGSVDIDSRNFSNYSGLTPNNSNTFLATTNVSGLTPSNPTSLPVFIPNCPSPPIISSATPACNGSTYQPYDRIAYQYSTYGSPSTYHLDRKPGGQAFTSQGDGYIGSYSSATNPIDDYAINNNTAYSYRMRADNGTYQSNPSAVVNATSRNCTPPTISVSTQCINNVATPEYTINVTSNANVGRDMWYSMDRQGGGNLAQVNIPGPNQTASRTFTSPPIANGAVSTFSSYSYNSGIAGSYINYVSISAPDCSLPRPFTVSLNTTPGAICPAEGLPKLNVIINKSANAATYELYTYERDSNNQYTILVARTDYTTNDLFPGVPPVSNVGSATRTFNVQPNKSYGVFVIARNSNGSWIYSNMATAMTSPTPAVWSYATIGYCDTTPPTVQLASSAECVQPNQLPTNLQLTIVDSPGSGAPVNSTSAVNPASIRFLLNELSAPGTVQQYTHQNQSGNIYSRAFTDPDFFAGVDKDYELSAIACDMNNNCRTMNKVGLSYARVCGAWIQTRQGNVHSEKEINAPGGP